MMRNPRVLLLLTLAIAVLSAPAGGQQRGVIPEDYFRMTFVGDVAVSPSGDLVAFTVTTVVEAENRRHRTIWMQRLRNGVPEGEPFRFTDPTREAWGPAWAPDGATLAFQSRRGEGSTTWFARVQAPGGEAYQVPGVDGSPLWSPDGRWIAYTRAPAGNDEGQSNTRAGWIAGDAVTRTLNAERMDGRVITSMRYKQDGVLPLLGHPDSRARQQLFVVSADGGTARQLTALPFNVSQVTWSGDGSALLFVGDDHEDVPQVDQTRAIYAISRDGGEPRRVSSLPGSTYAPAVSPSGSHLAFLHLPETGEETDLHVVEISPSGDFRGASRNLTGGWNLGPGSPEWSPDGSSVRFSAGIRGNNHLFEVPAAGGAVRQVTQGDRQLSSISRSSSGQVMAYTATDAARPAEVFVSRADGSQERSVTSFNASWLGSVAINPAEPLTWRVADGTEIEGWVVRPVNQQAGRRYPMVLKIHGGPHGAYGNTFFQTFHVLSAAGFYVFYPNPRGSTGYGNDFAYATRGRWGEMDQEDFLTGVDAVLAKYPDIDPARIGVSGGSYGGYMTNWLTSRSDRFAAAVTSRR